MGISPTLLLWYSWRQRWTDFEVKRSKVKVTARLNMIKKHFWKHTLHTHQLQEFLQMSNLSAIGYKDELITYSSGSAASYIHCLTLHGIALHWIFVFSHTVLLCYFHCLCCWFLALWLQFSIKSESEFRGQKVKCQGHSKIFWQRHTARYRPSSLIN